MGKARAFILDKGGIIKSRVFTKIFLALFGEFSWFGVPSMPIELMLLPNWAYFNMYEFSSWARATIIPLSVVMAERPVRKLPPWARVQELYVRPPRPTDYTFTKEDGILTWKNFFIGVDHLLKIYESSPIRPFMKKGTRNGRTMGTGSSGADRRLGRHPAGHAQFHSGAALPGVCQRPSGRGQGAGGAGQFLHRGRREPGAAILRFAGLGYGPGAGRHAEAGVPADHPALVKAAQWLLDREVRRKGDWQIKSPELEPGGWAFEFLNDWYPGCGRSGFVMMAIKDIKVRDKKHKEQAIKRGIDWCLGMQSKNGGWGAFDKDNTKHLLNKIPFADLEALIDPPTADLTGRMLELMGNFGYPERPSRRCPRPGIPEKDQEPEGPWWGRWGVNYIYGTWSVLCGLEAIGEDMTQPYIKKAVNWFKSKQNMDGGWGEICESYHDRSLMGCGESTAFPDRLGAVVAYCGRRGRFRGGKPAGSSICSPTRSRTEPGTRMPSPAPVSPSFS